MDNKRERPKEKVVKVWHTQQEHILKNWGETSACYRYLHYRAYQKFKKQSMAFTIPIIVISTITGTANFAQETFSPSVKSYVPAGIGTLNLIAAIMTTISQFLKVSELMESHRVCSVHYGKLSRNIRLELTLPLQERSHDGSNMIEICRSEFDRLIEQSPPIPGDVLRKFEHKMNADGGTYSTPEILNVQSIVPYNGHREIELMKRTVDKFKHAVQEADIVHLPQKAGNSIINEIKGLRRKGVVKKHLDDIEKGVQLPVDGTDTEHDEDEDTNENEVKSSTT